MESKKRRINEVNNEIVKFDTDVLLDNLNEFPFIYRSIQAVSFMKSNPLVLPMNLSKKEYLILTRNYIFEITKMFFGGCGLSYNLNDQSLSDERMEIFIETPVNETMIDINFSLFMSFLEFTLKSSYSSKIDNLRSIGCRGEGNLIWIEIDLSSDDSYFNAISYFRRNLMYKYLKPDGNINI